MCTGENFIVNCSSIINVLKLSLQASPSGVGFIERLSAPLLFTKMSKTLLHITDFIFFPLDPGLKRSTVCD